MNLTGHSSFSYCWSWEVTASWLPVVEFWAELVGILQDRWRWEPLTLRGRSLLLGHHTGRNRICLQTFCFLEFHIAFRCFMLENFETIPWNQPLFLFHQCSDQLDNDPKSLASYSLISWLDWPLFYALRALWFYLVLCLSFFALPSLLSGVPLQCLW